MKQNVRLKILSIAFILTGIGAAFVSIKNSNWSSDDSSSIIISIDSTTLSKVTLVYDTQTTILSKGPQYWTVNSNYKARPNFIQLMIVGLAKSEIKRPVANENKQKVITLLKTKGVKIKTENGDQQKSFYLASNDNDANSSYFMEDGGTEPYIIFVSGFSGDMSNLFKLDEASWRSRELFTSTPLSLQKISVSYPMFPKSNVAIQWNKDKTFAIEGIKDVDSSKIINYLAQFEQVNIDQYIYKNKELTISLLRKNKPQAIISVADLRSVGSHTLEIYGESTDPKGIYAIVLPENELVTMKPETLFRLLVRKEFFEKKSKE